MDTGLEDTTLSQWLAAGVLLVVCGLLCNKIGFVIDYCRYMYIEVIM